MSKEVIKAIATFCLILRAMDERQEVRQTTTANPWCDSLGRRPIWDRLVHLPES